jgi:N-acetylglutamate synthase-like GNAT family acetyltransferase
MAFASVVTDAATFAWIRDLCVDKHHCGRGAGTWLVESIAAALGADGIRRLLLVTRDAQEVYRRCGFAAP